MRHFGKGTIRLHRGVRGIPTISKISKVAASRDSSAGQPASMFVQRLNAMTGDYEWVVVEYPGKFDGAAAWCCCW